MFFRNSLSLFPIILLATALTSIVNVEGHRLSARQNKVDASERLLQGNAQWAASTKKDNTTFFQTSAKGQDPKVLWYGCADSREPESVITNSIPGDIFVHRNIANQVPPEDANSVSVLEYAIKHLKVEHVIIAGHTNCGGANASLSAALAGSSASQTLSDEPSAGALNKWLEPLTEFALSQKSQLSAKSNSDALTVLVEENVKKQVENVSNSEAIQAAWQAETNGTGRAVRVHGWVYDLSTGLIRDLNVTRGPN
ncbi:carbonic anhydrase [Crepidotus variabilis]|uniref:Carbonic anhydrase n=1 Tax=Crepidotus variabilis TaxID=179855 RepID=A0A9P6EID4_9AGAR|nr:carbonic anhydrase [Crepidotus variabilis]